MSTTFVTSATAELLDHFARHLKPGGVPPRMADELARVVLSMPNESRNDRINQISAWLTALDQLAAGYSASLIPSPSTPTPTRAQ